MINRIKLIVILVIACLPAAANAQWYGSVDFMLPTRASDGNTVFQRNQTTGPNRVGNTVLLDENDLKLDFAPAGRVTIGNRTSEFGFEGSYMITEEWNEVVSAFDAGALQASPFSIVGATPSAFVDNNTSVVVNYTTEMETAELNLAQRIYSGPNGNASLFYGTRYMSIEESMLYRSTNAGFNHSLLTTTDNQMIGPQLGTLLEAPFPGGQLSFAFKVSMTYNQVDKTTLFDGTLGTGSDTSASMLSEINVNCLFYPAPNFSVELGYQLLAATDVALATGNLERNLAVLGSGLANVQTNRAVAYHSPYVGLVFRY
jgi:hypothetical protein